MGNFCSTHAHDVHNEIKKRNMWHMVSKDATQAKRRAQLWLAGQATEKDFDPLMILTLELNNKTLETAGFPGKYCPLCFSQHSLGDKVAKIWIEKCMDSIVIAAKSSSILTLRGHKRVNGHDNSQKIITVK